MSENRDAYVDGIVDDDTDTIESEEEMFCISYLSYHLDLDVEYRMRLDDYAAEYPLEH